MARRPALGLTAGHRVTDLFPVLALLPDRAVRRVDCGPVPSNPHRPDRTGRHGLGLPYIRAIADRLIGAAHGALRLRIPERHVVLAGHDGEKDLLLRCCGSPADHLRPGAGHDLAEHGVVRRLERGRGAPE